MKESFKISCRARHWGWSPPCDRVLISSLTCFTSISIFWPSSFIDTRVLTVFFRTSSLAFIFFMSSLVLHLFWCLNRQVSFSEHVFPFSHCSLTWFFSHCSLNLQNPTWKYLHTSSNVVLEQVCELKFVDDLLKPRSHQ